jgi:WD40 repeat protein
VSPAKPEYKLTRVPQGDGSGATTEAPEIIAVTDMPWAGRTDRRGFLGAGLAAGAALLVAESDIARAALQSAKAASAGGCLWAYDAPVLALAASPTGDVLVSGGGGSTGTVKVWLLPEGTLVTRLNKGKSPTLALAITSKGLLVVGEGSPNGSTGALELWSMHAGALTKQLGGNQGDVSALALSRNEQVLASVCSISDSVEVWSLPDGNLMRTLRTGLAHAVALSQNGDLLAAGGRGGFIQLWDVPAGTLQKKVNAGSGDVLALAMSQDGKTLYSGGSDGTIKIWSVPSLTLTKTLKAHTAAVSALAIDPSGWQLASGSFDREVKLWNLPSGSLAMTMTGHTDKVSSVAFNSEGTILASGSYDKTIRLWDVGTGRVSRCLADPQANPAPKPTCTCVGHPTCTCVSYTACSCVGHPSCSCVSYTACSCVSYTACTCQSVGSSHYWYPN